MRTACGDQGFIKEYITNMKQSIKFEFEKNEEFEITEVDQIIESPKMVTGLVKISISGNYPAMKDCSTKGQGDRFNGNANNKLKIRHINTLQVTICNYSN